MVFHLSILLYAYYIFVAVWLVFSLVGAYHVVRFSQINMISLFSLVVYAAGSLVIFSFSNFFISQIDWSAPIPLISNLITINF